MLQAERITAVQAREFWRDPSQHVRGTSPDSLPDDPQFHYWACGPICVVFHPALWPGVWMAHYGCKPEGKGRYVEPAKVALMAFWRSVTPSRVVGWTEAKNRLALAFARRVGFTVDGVLSLPEGDVIMQGWRAE